MVMGATPQATPLTKIVNWVRDPLTRFGAGICNVHGLVWRAKSAWEGKVAKEVDGKCAL